ncbi:MAG: AAA family ATPase, partial [Acidobacteriota bacterium]|nr:AAA family ATPase [Acidobacteriota bacterium]
MEELVSDYFGLSTRDIRRLMPALASIDPSEWAENSVVGFTELGDEMRRVFLSEGAPTRGRASGSSVARPPAVPIELNERIKRMVRLAIASYPAVILVGPPGTGKTSLIKQILAELENDYSDYGLTRAPGAAKWVTPDESWTARDLVGGVTLD